MASRRPHRNCRKLYSHDQQEIVQIKTISNGVITFDTGLSYRHYGSSDATKYLIHGIDLRSEVVLLSRNIRIKPVDDASVPWGCQTLTTDLIVPSMTPLIGKSIFSYVEFSKCGQYDTQKATVRFFNSSNWDSESVVTQCAIHSGGAAGIDLDKSKNIVVNFTNVFKTTQFGIKVKGSDNWKLDNNRFLGVKQRDVVLNDGLVDESGIVYICPPYGGDCKNY